MTILGKSKIAEHIKDQLELYSLILDCIHNGVIVTDADGYVIYINKPYGRFLGVDHQEQIGKHCTEVVENSRMQIVARTGVPEINQSHLINGQNMVVQRIPIKKDGKVVAVYGQVMFKNTKDLTKLARKLSALESKVKEYEKELFTLRARRYTFDSIIGTSDKLISLKLEAMKAAANSFPVLITGESGTGKELFAQAIHNASSRADGPFVRFNCSAIPKELIESELFGYEKGAFTDASASGKEGKFEQADGGTIFLDEIGDMAFEMQPKLLRVLEEKEFSRLGGKSVIRSDFRLITATNQDLQVMVQKKKFRLDLFYRLNVIPLHIPPLRERPEDIIPLASYMLKKLAEMTRIGSVSLSPEAERLFMNNGWPGNARELRNVLARTISSLEGDTIYLKDLPCELFSKSRATEGHYKEEMIRVSAKTSLRDIQRESERELILRTLQNTSYNKTKASAILGIHRTLLYKKMEKYNIPLCYT
ncbi:MAG TPA: sigma 54-interacting transcriptional regulator [Smithellaceae bacterium]|nr:sigma 54-interacting transcriptional regulator [Smithellaceae bacterium]HQG81286.1 sigma 54-interacting transcriptional regulator [Smithellaceae bacterium]